MVPTYVDIQEVSKTTIRTSNKIGIFIVNLELFKSANVHVHFYDNIDGKGVMDVKELKLEGDDYDKWASDDSYIVTYVLNKLNLQNSI